MIVICTLGAICGRFRQVFGSLLFALLFLHIKRRKVRVTPDERVPQIALVSQSNAESRHKNTIFIKPHNFHFLYSAFTICTVFPIRENAKNILVSAIFLCAGLLAWTRLEDICYKLHKFRLHSALSLVNLKQQSHTCQHDNRLSTSCVQKSRMFL